MVKHVSMVLSMVSEHTFQQYIRLQWYYQWYFRIPFYAIGLLNDKSRFNGNANGI